MGCERRALRSADQDATVAEVIARLRAGELVVLPTETVYGLAVLPSHRDAVARVRRWKGRADQLPFTSHIGAQKDLQRLARSIPPGVQRLIERYWPGPLTVIVPARSGDGDSVGVRLPAHGFTRAVIRAAGEPLWLTSCNRTGEPPLVDPERIVAALGDVAQLIVDDGRSPLGVASTIVRATGPRLEILREGILSASDVLHTAARLVLFVCTGNTCRSPLAAALARELTARTLGVPAADVLAHGFQFASAGTSAYPGHPASDGSLAVAAELDLDLGTHRSEPLSPELLARADLVFCLGRGHLQAILAEAPEAAHKLAMLRPDGLDVADPYGTDLPIYRRVRDEIRAAVGARLPQWLPTATS
ncbi:MAG: threonylcarbamoyl-AMP synthase [Planctomycetes bacterium]|nr:threonylcarbamoyl-AMP synthase [Planctomycetota bacterium]